MILTVFIWFWRLRRARHQPLSRRGHGSCGLRHVFYSVLLVYDYSFRITGAQCSSTFSRVHFGSFSIVQPHVNDGHNSSLSTASVLDRQAENAARSVYRAGAAVTAARCQRHQWPLFSTVRVI